MAAISHVFTIRRAAQILGHDEDLLWQLSDQLEPEDGKLWVYDIDGAETPAFTHDGIEALREIIKDQIDRAWLISRRVYRGAQRMLTLNREPYRQLRLSSDFHGCYLGFRVLAGEMGWHRL